MHFNYLVINMSASASFFTPKYASLFPEIKKTAPPKPIQKSKFNAIPWLKLIHAASAVVLGSIFIPHFAFACAVAMGTLVFKIITVLLLSTLIKSETKKSYSDFVTKNQIYVTFIGPITEELIFRGAVLPLSLLTIGLLFPASLTTPFFGLGISMAAACALIISSVSFGLVHYGNGGKNHLQVISSALGGIVYGLLSLQFGLITAIGAHIFNNFFITAISNLAPEPKKPKEEENLGLQPSMA